MHVKVTCGSVQCAFQSFKFFEFLTQKLVRHFFTGATFVAFLSFPLLPSASPRVPSSLFSASFFLGDDPDLMLFCASEAENERGRLELNEGLNVHDGSRRPPWGVELFRRPDFERGAGKLHMPLTLSRTPPKIRSAEKLTPPPRRSA